MPESLEIKTPRPTGGSGSQHFLSKGRLGSKRSKRKVGIERNNKGDGVIGIGRGNFNEPNVLTLTVIVAQRSKYTGGILEVLELEGVLANPLSL